MVDLAINMTIINSIKLNVIFSILIPLNAYAPMLLLPCRCIVQIFIIPWFDFPVLLDCIDNNEYLTIIAKLLT